MTIEIDEKDFREIQDKIGEIRGAAIVSKMIDQENCVHRLDLITSWANEITALLNGSIVAMTPPETTKFIERYNNWICEKCGYKWESESNILPAEWSIDSPDKYFKCQGCQRGIIKFVPLVREGG